MGPFKEMTANFSFVANCTEIPVMLSVLGKYHQRAWIYAQTYTWIVEETSFVHIVHITFGQYCKQSSNQRKAKLKFRSGINSFV